MNEAGRIHPTSSRCFHPFLQAMLLFLFAGFLAADEVLLLIEKTGPNGIVCADIDLTGALGMVNRSGGPSAFPSLSLKAFIKEAHEVPVQFVPAWDHQPSELIAGKIILKLPSGFQGTVRLECKEKSPAASSDAWNGTIRTSYYEITHDPQKQGGFPSKIIFPETKKTFTSFRWNDRVYRRTDGSFLPAGDRKAKVTLIEDGPICTVVRVQGNYMQGNKQPAAKPHAIYYWYYFKNSPLIYVAAEIFQDTSSRWDELHFLELNSSDRSFTHWAGGTPFKTGAFKAEKKSIRNNRWGAFIEERNAIAMARCGTVLLYDGRGSGGTYLHAWGNRAWGGWDGGHKHFSAWLCIGAFEKPLDALQRIVLELPVSEPPTVTTSAVHARIENARKKAQAAPPANRQKLFAACDLAEKLQRRSQFSVALQIIDGELPEQWISLTAGDLRFIFNNPRDGIEPVSLYDLGASQEFLFDEPDTPPLFSIALQNTTTKERIELGSDKNWKKVEIAKHPGKVTISFAAPQTRTKCQVHAEVGIIPDPASHAFRWNMSVENKTKTWTIRRITFPQLSLAEPVGGGTLFYPEGPGVVRDTAWREPFHFEGRYPGGRVTMQFLAAYSTEKNTGIYSAIHDPRAATKRIKVQSFESGQGLLTAYQYPVENMGKAGNDFTLSGRAVTQLLRGDWYDAACIYRRWAEKNARWYPEIGKNGRADTPLWMKELPVWALTGGAPESCVPQVKAFAEYMGVPVGFHWYNWHTIPFDNDYPHYFPSKEGFREGVSELKKSGVYVMPYINGRLWDTHDRENKDYRFSRVALPAATKKENGTPYTERYRSKEKDGTPVTLAVMCPATELWQKKVRETVLRLMNEKGVNGVYIDQIAAAVPMLCFDESHGHPLGGGHWWIDGYAAMLTSIRKQMPTGRMLTTECTAEPYAKWVDGYLSWDWQYQGQVPALPAVYSGALQLFGRAYRQGPTPERALRMKAAQQLVFGEQLGWLHPDVINRKTSAAFLRRLVRLRWKLRRYFFAGRLARPPKLPDTAGEMRADWQWGGERWITLKKVQAGARLLPQEKSLLLLFANASDEPIKTVFRFEGEKYGLKADRFSAKVHTGETILKQFTLQKNEMKTLELSPFEAVAWEIAPE